MQGFLVGISLALTTILGAGNGGAPPASSHIITEDSNNIVAENGDQLVTE